MIILMSWMKPSPSGLSWEPRSGQKCPIRTPATTAIRIWKKSDLYRGFFFDGAELAFSAAESGIFIDLYLSIGNSPGSGSASNVTPVTQFRKRKINFHIVKSIPTLIWKFLSRYRERNADFGP
jgi:hypothetical protein